jgi:hypothetical protein
VWNSFIHYCVVARHFQSQPLYAPFGVLFKICELCACACACVVRVRVRDMCSYPIIKPVEKIKAKKGAKYSVESVDPKPA